MNPWWQAGLSLLVGLLTAAGAFLGVRLSVRANDRATVQRELSARREEWWRRFTWAAELALDESPVRRVTGLKLLAKLAQSELAERDECLLLDVFQGRVLDSLLDELDQPDEERSAS
ncbi:hypothetical protein VSH64_26135 [Amycolatopsis rhabdoformis]|uniref:HEAT repeat domain-containing protein n=1 Tax=Amycolatopsis rhabdoformis TaxID=1448059 RepID=A0ABZ1HY96_9PSEU|nr:hypothetical protein [Amycolatopsis rhabdoformis]WSE26359.1 hypothetical protein VSH64_26135 [Amycolatopsis rhabdoformis]